MVFSAPTAYTQAFEVSDSWFNPADARSPLSIMNQVAFLGSHGSPCTQDAITLSNVVIEPSGTNQQLIQVIHIPPGNGMIGKDDSLPPSQASIRVQWGSQLLLPIHT